MDVREQTFPPLPPWRDKGMKIEPSLTQKITKECSVERRLAVANETIDTRYTEHLKIYTDGSITEESTSAAIWIPEIPHEENWKLNLGTARNTMGAELFALNKALTWLALHSVILTKMKVVILTDTMSGILAMNSYYPSSHAYTINLIRDKYRNLSAEGFDITFQWVPSHTGVPGNERADDIAKAAHTNNDEIPCHLDKTEVKSLLRASMIKDWQQKFDIVKGELHLGDIKSKIKNWPWVKNKNRRIETALARLSLGHVGLNKHLNRFNQADSPLCQRCNTDETTEHFLRQCTNYGPARRKMLRNLQLLNIDNPSIAVLLGGGDFSKDKQNKIGDIVSNYLCETGRLGDL